MSSTEGLLRSVLDSPASDVARLAYADAIASTDPDRAEFIRTQIRLAQSWNNPSVSDREQVALYDRSNKLIETFGRKWADTLAHYADGWQFRRGFVELIKTDAMRFVDRAEALFRLAPIAHADLTNAAGHVARLAQCPALQRLRSVGLGRNNLTDADAVLLAQSPFVTELRWLDLSLNRIGRDGAEAICCSPQLRSLRYLAFHGNPVDPTDRIGAVDPLDGSVTEIEQSPFGAELEAKHGRMPFLHVDPTVVGDYPPDRFI